MSAPSDLTWLEQLVEGHYGFAPTGELRNRLSSVYSNPREREAHARGERLREVIETIVIGETYFFRERAQVEYVIRKWVTEASASKPLRILSAGCSSGEEPYSLAILLEAARASNIPDVSIVGIDISEAAIQKAQKARYSAWALRAIPEQERLQYFRRVGDEYQLLDRFRSRVKFEQRNLFDVDPEFWSHGAFDIIFCRNVTIYFTPRAIRDLASRFAYVLAPGGCLFLGHSETLRGISTDFNLVHESDVFYYRRRDEAVKASAPAVKPELDKPISLPQIDRPVVEPLPAPVLRSKVPRRVSESSEATLIGQRILSLIEMERFDEAWVLLGELPANAHATLLTAVIGLAKGLFEETERACHALISLNEFEADAHCLLGSCREHQRAFDSAERHYREAARLDPRFAMPHLRLGFLLERSGDSEGGRVELTRAVERMELEHPDRVVLFGGGFSRKVLLELCKDHLVAPGNRVGRSGEEVVRKLS